jgi:hypothetical protein
MTTLDSPATAATAVAVRKAARIVAQCCPHCHPLLPMRWPATPPAAAYTAALNTAHHPPPSWGGPSSISPASCTSPMGAYCPVPPLSGRSRNSWRPHCSPPALAAAPYRPCCGSRCHCCDSCHPCYSPDCTSSSPGHLILPAALPVAPAVVPTIPAAAHVAAGPPMEQHRPPTERHRQPMEQHRPPTERHRLPTERHRPPTERHRPSME